MLRARQITASENKSENKIFISAATPSSASPKQQRNCGTLLKLTVSPDLQVDLDPTSLLPGQPPGVRASQLSSDCFLLLADGRGVTQRALTALIP